VAQRIDAARALGLVLLDSQTVVHPQFKDARVRTPLIVKLDAKDDAKYLKEWFGPIAFVIATDGTGESLEIARRAAVEHGALTLSMYSTSPAVIDDAKQAEVRDALPRAKADASLRVLLLTGSGRAFCAGQDLGDRAAAPGAEPVDLGASIERNYRPLVLALRRLPLPVVCAVNGVAAGAGANIALACDIVVAAKSASFIQAFSKIGLIPDSGGTYFLPRLVGSARAIGLAMLGERLIAEQAAEWGLIWQCVEDNELHETVEKLLRTLAGAPTA